MFTGIVEELGTVRDLEDRRLRVEAGVVLEDAKLGASVAVNGACLSVTEIGDGALALDVVPETLRRTNLGGLRPGDRVNLERPLAFGGRVGGHLVQGHVDGTAQILDITEDGDAVIVRFQTPEALMPYIVEKGFVAVDGVSLTVVGTGPEWFSVTLIPITRAETVVGTRGPGDQVNIEVDILAKYVERMLQGKR